MQYGKQVTLQSFDKTGPGAYLLGKFPRKHKKYLFPGLYSWQILFQSLKRLNNEKHDSQVRKEPEALATAFCFASRLHSSASKAHGTCDWCSWQMTVKTPEAAALGQNLPISKA